MNLLRVIRAIQINLRPMFFLREISLYQFRNYLQSAFSFQGRVTGITGLNGSGKTNLLDAIYFLCFSRSHIHRSDAANVAHGQQGFRLEGDFRLMQDEFRVTSILRENGKKELLVNGEPLKKLSSFMGRFPVVMIAPDDASLITGTSEERRKWLDTILSQLDPHYLQQLIAYQRTLTQRNHLLKQVQENGSVDEALLQVINNQLIQYGIFLFRSRTDFLASFLPMVMRLYLQIAGSNDRLAAIYESHLQQKDFSQLLAETRERDIVLARTTRGPHRDDLVFQMGQQPFKAEASQGQRKSLLFALKLAEWEVLENTKGFPPILLLDDLFEKLDGTRMHQLLQRVVVEGKGQVFITDTDADRLKAHLDPLGVPYQLIAV
ncbi:MAG: DNA replication/repair protein RecF [Bacteroidota bacterium]|jgi:DNA replication and repair protein RecF